MKVKILIGIFKDSVGILENKISNSSWYNVRVSPTLRLALTEEEFEIID